MRLSQQLLVGIMMLGTTVASHAKDFDDSRIGHKEFPDWFIENTFLDLSDAVETASTSGKKGLMVVFSTKGCSYCAVFNDKSLGNPEISAKVRKHFDSVGMEIFDDAEMVSPAGESLPIKQFAKQEGVQFSPTILFYDNTGKRILRKTGYQSPERFNQILDYISGDHYANQKLSEYIESDKQVAVSEEAGVGLLDNDMFERPPYALDRSRFPAEKPMVVLFEKKNCRECVGFHEQVLADVQVIDTLKQFNVVRMDINDNKTPVIAPDGERTTPAKWYKRYEFSRTPSLLFIDNNGNEALNTDALVLRQRMMNSLNYMLEKAYEKGWTYQRFARSKAIARNLEKQQQTASVNN